MFSFWFASFFQAYAAAMLPSLLIGYIADLIFGDPHTRWHPICLIGRLISALEAVLRRERRKNCDIFGKKQTRDDAHPKTERLLGCILVLCVLVCVCIVSAGVLALCHAIHFGLGLGVQSFFVYTILATKSLRVESKKVYDALQTDGLIPARKALSMIVGRDTDVLDETGVIKAAVETVAENTSDGVIAPLIYLAIGGPVLGFFYKAVNTMDSMVGYKNEKYRYFGTAAARLDDVLNFIPARISALLMIAATGLCFPAKGKKRQMPGKTISVRHAIDIWIRDRANHASPNSAQTEAVMAGALGIELAGDAVYFGKLHKKPTIGDALCPVEAEDILRANRLLYGTSLLAMVLITALYGILIGIGW